VEAKVEASLINLPAFFRPAWSASLPEKARAHTQTHYDGARITDQAHREGEAVLRRPVQAMPVRVQA
jgi:hypothetical protein